MRLVLSTFMTLDGIVEAPGFDEHREGRNAWALRVQTEDDEAYNEAQVRSADAILLGRRTWQIWAAFWPTASGPLAERMNRIPKYVVSNTLTRADWSNTTIISGDIRREVEALKAQPGRELVVYGSPDLVDELLKHDLIDEYRITVYPVILGSGKRLFRDRIDLHHLRLIRSRTFASGVVLLCYVPESEAPTSRYVEEYAWTPEQVRSLEDARDVERVVATVLFADIVGSTDRAAEMGDRAWRELIDRYAEAVRTEVHRWVGVHLELTGDGVMAVFETPTRALRCAFAIIEAIAPLGVEVRAGIHTGEVERREAGFGGIGVHIGARVMGHAGPSEVVATRTVRELAAGTGMAFEARGAHGLKGVPGEWELFSVRLDGVRGRS